MPGQKKNHFSTSLHGLPEASLAILGGRRPEINCRVWCPEAQIQAVLLYSICFPFECLCFHLMEGFPAKDVETIMLKCFVPTTFRVKIRKEYALKNQ